MTSGDGLDRRDQDRKHTAQFEHTILVTEDGARDLDPSVDAGLRVRRATALPRSDSEPGTAFEVEINDQWGGLGSVNGGFMLATCLKALDAALASRTRSWCRGCSCARPPGGSVVAVEPIRIGRTTAFGEARLVAGRQGGSAANRRFADLSAATPEYNRARRPSCTTLPRWSGSPAGGHHRSRSGSSTRAAVPSRLATGKPSASRQRSSGSGSPTAAPATPDAAVHRRTPPPRWCWSSRVVDTIELTNPTSGRGRTGLVACRVRTPLRVGVATNKEDFEAWESSAYLCRPVPPAGPESAADAWPPVS